MVRVLSGKAGGILSYFVRHRTVANLLLILLLAAGAVSIPNMRAQFFPDVIVDDVDVSVRHLVIRPGGFCVACVCLWQHFNAPYSVISLRVPRPPTYLSRISPSCRTFVPPASFPFQQLEKDAKFMDKKSRMIATFGLESMAKWIAMRILIVGMKGLGAEAAKNIMLSGPKALTIIDSTKKQHHQQHQRTTPPHSHSPSPTSTVSSRRKVCS